MNNNNNYIIVNTKQLKYHIKKKNYTQNIRKQWKIEKTNSTHKKEKILLSCLYNNHLPNQTFTILHKKTYNNKINENKLGGNLPNIKQNSTYNIQSTLWLRKTYDINRLYPWTKIQKRLTKLTKLNIRNQILAERKIRFTTQQPQLKRQWAMHPLTTHHTHYRLLFKTKYNPTQQINTIKQHNIKNLTKNTHIKNIMNVVYGKHKIRHIDNKNNNKNESKKPNKTITIIEYSKLKLKRWTKKNLTEKLDTNTTTHIYKKHTLKNKGGYQKNEKLSTHTPQYDNFKICNLIIKKNVTNRINIQQHRKKINDTNTMHKHNNN